MARPRVRFEGEEGVGAGPLREFSQVAVKIAEEGIGFNPKPVIYYEGKPDHKLPVQSPSLRNTGSFGAVGQILALIFTWWPLYSWFVKSCHALLCISKKARFIFGPPPLELQDVADYDLRMLLKEVLDSTLIPKIGES